MKINNWMYPARKYIQGYGLMGSDAVDVASSFLDGVALQYWQSVEKSLIAQLMEITLFYRIKYETFCKVIEGRFLHTNHVADMLKNVSFETNYECQSLKYPNYFVGIFSQNLQYQMPS